MKKFQFALLLSITAAASGCGKKAEYVVICPEGDTGCFAARRDMPGN